MGVAKIAVVLVSLMLVVGVVMGVVMLVKIHNREAEEGIKPVSATKMVTSICGRTHYKDVCVATLEPVAKNASATPNDYIRALVEATLREVNNAVAATAKVSVDKSKDEHSHEAVEDCKRLLEFAVDTLQDSISTVGDDKLRTSEDQQHELLSWMTAVYAFQTTCTDLIPNPEFKSAIQNGMLNSTQFTHNAVNVIADLSEMLKLFHIQVPATKQVSASHRRLLGLEEGFPYWFGAAERKLLAQQDLVPNVVVAKDGSGQYKTINDALKAYPHKFQGRYVIYVKAGVYAEKVIVHKKTPNVFMYGDGIGKTIVTGKLNYGKMNVKTMNTATFANEAVGFVARGMTFRNEAGPEGHQAVAFRSIGDKTALFDCSFEGSQDTLYYQSMRQYYKNCRIYGTVDFIFGKGDCVIQDSEIVVRKPMPNQINTITADGREIEKGSNGLIIHHCNISPDEYLYPARFQIPTFLGRPWKRDALTVTMQSNLGDLIRPEGYKIWDGENNHKTCEMYEFANTGPGANTDRRSKDFSKFKLLSHDQAQRFAAGNFLGPDWLQITGVPVQMGLY